MLWTEKYKPKSLREFVDQKPSVERFLQWIKSWKPGSKALLLYGKPGVGKTALVEAFASQEKYELIAMNASDARSAERIRAVLTGASQLQPLFKRSRIFLIDEIDGISGKEDRGGVGEVINLIKKSSFPVVLIANNPFLPKLRSLREHCELVEMRPIGERYVLKRLEYICEKEKIKAEREVLKSIAARSNGDLRAAITDLETVARNKDKITLQDLEALGYREREESIFDALKIIFKTKRAISAKLAIASVDADPEEIFWWIENNVANEYEKPEEIARAYDYLSKAALFQRYISIRQNWHFRSYMIDMMCGGVALSKKEVYRKFTKYKYPSRLAILGATKIERKEEREMLLELSKQLHCSTKKIRREFLPYFRIFGT